MLVARRDAEDMPYGQSSYDGTVFSDSTKRIGIAVIDELKVRWCVLFVKKCSRSDILRLDSSDPADCVVTMFQLRKIGGCALMLVWHSVPLRRGSYILVTISSEFAPMSNKLRSKNYS
ncbi:hypothetical protein ETB97_006880 [Aspergillus alliaceus]|uniref:Uncharacterized protein n=1 Tax=Petromyces alliaceus TaxID=209559 RepID=A0A8H6AGW0_PETAA|nr:hypothetical protein ETB97_006880 [Aspergillus burnettii]